MRLFIRFSWGSSGRGCDPWKPRFVTRLCCGFHGVGAFCECMVLKSVCLRARQGAPTALRGRLGPGYSVATQGVPVVKVSVPQEGSITTWLSSALHGVTTPQGSGVRDIADATASDNATTSRIAPASALSRSAVVAFSGYA
jgi:hypothetical protein